LAPLIREKHGDLERASWDSGQFRNDYAKFIGNPSNPTATQKEALDLAKFVGYMASIRGSDGPVFPSVHAALPVITALLAKAETDAGKARALATFLDILMLADVRSAQDEGILK
jgi:hypothetical protein